MIGAAHAGRCVVARAPARVSFGGGGTDLAVYYQRFGGLVVSAAIARYATAVARRSPDGATRIHSADYRVVECAPPGAPFAVKPPLALPKAVLAWFNARGLLTEGVELFLESEAPPGAGLGSSSAMAVAIARALAGYRDLALDAGELAEIACWAEIERLGMPIGKQDQYASACGGLNEFAFAADRVTVTPLAPPPDVLNELDRRLLLFSTGRTRNSADVLRGQRADTAVDPAVIAGLHELKALAGDLRDALLAGDLDAFGRLLDRGWQTKRRLSARISSPEIDGWYAAARAAGALGGKISGAGGGGFLLLYVPTVAQPRLRATMREHGLCELPFAFDTGGATLTAATRARANQLGATGHPEAATTDSLTH